MEELFRIQQSRGESTTRITTGYAKPKKNESKSHPLRAAARFMKQKADHHLEYLADRAERNKQLQSFLPSATGTASPSLSAIGHSALGGSGLTILLGSRLRDEGLGGDEDAAGESDDAFGEGDAEGEVDREGNDVLDVRSQDFREGGAETRGERGETPSEEQQKQSPLCHAHFLLSFYQAEVRTKEVEGPA